MVQAMPGAVSPLRHPSVSRFEVHAERCPHLFAKIAGIFANRAVMPHNVHMRRSAKGMWIAIEADVTGGLGMQIAEKLRCVISVDAVIYIPAPLDMPPGGRRGVRSI